MSIVPKDWTPTASAIFYQEQTTQHDGDRVYGCLDCEGHPWYFGQRVDDAAWEAATQEGKG
jgi:hypothetical protein